MSRVLSTRLDPRALFHIILSALFHVILSEAKDSPRYTRAQTILRRAQDDGLSANLALDIFPPLWYSEFQKRQLKIRLCII